jgi:2-C-methyl-D-erythritol 4-phosphate cytidylyltransferase/2-C-methyl-D-erythritol 2,4-cyclodiphosphate synthase
MINKTAAIIAAAGAGNRLGANLPKALVKLLDKTLVEHAVANLAPIAQHIVVTAPSGFEDEFKKVLGDQVTVITGGVLRSDSIRIALASIPNQYEYVLVHDAARSLAPTALAKSVIDQLVNGEQAVVPVLDLVDTIKEVDASGYVRNTPDRSSLRAVQTPQGFTKSVLERAHQASDDATDDAALVEALGVKVKTIAGDERALKITNKSDLSRALEILHPDSKVKLRVGIGTDAHAFSTDKNRKLSLACLTWSDEIGLDGHSDGDVASHAICDALLAAANLGDLGSNFGVADAKYAGASGAQMLAESLAKVKAAGFNIENVSVSATSTDGLGFTGEGKGLSAIATALLVSA